MPSFDAVCEPNQVDIRHAVENSAKEIGTRFDFKGTSAAIDFKDNLITLVGDAEFQLSQLLDVLRGKLTKRQVDVRFLEVADPEKAGGDKVKQKQDVHLTVDYDSRSNTSFSQKSVIQLEKNWNIN